MQLALKQNPTYNYVVSYYIQSLSSVILKFCHLESFLDSYNLNNVTTLLIYFNLLYAKKLILRRFYIYIFYL